MIGLAEKWLMKERNARRYDRFESITHQCLAAGVMAVAVAVVAPAIKRERLVSVASPRKEINVQNLSDSLDKIRSAPPL